MENQTHNQRNSNTAELTIAELDAVSGGSRRNNLFSMMNSIVAKFDESAQKVLQKLGQ